MLHQLSRPVSHKRKSIQIGRGNGSGRGNYSTRWLKGQKARTWFSQQPGFEHLFIWDYQNQEDLKDTLNWLIM